MFVTYIAINRQKGANGDRDGKRENVAHFPHGRFDMNHSTSHVRELGAKMAQYITKGSRWGSQLAPMRGADYIETTRRRTQEIRQAVPDVQCRLWIVSHGADETSGFRDDSSTPRGWGEQGGQLCAPECE